MRAADPMLAQSVSSGHSTNTSFAMVDPSSSGHRHGKSVSVINNPLDILIYIRLYHTTQKYSDQRTAAIELSRYKRITMSLQPPPNLFGLVHLHPHSLLISHLSRLHCTAIMLFGQVLSLLFLLFTATAVEGRKKSRPGHPQATCIIHENESHRDTYHFRGRNWNITETDFKDAIDTEATVLSRWEWTEAIDDDGAQVFKAKVRSMCSSRIRGNLRRPWNADTFASSRCRSEKSGRRGRNWGSLLSHSHSRSSVGNRTSRAISAIGSLMIVRTFLMARSLTIILCRGTIFKRVRSWWTGMGRTGRV
jgi:hypothetical protein